VLRGDGHNHWHVQDLEDFNLVRLDNGRLVGAQARHGFCIYDNYRNGSDQPAFYTRSSGVCGESPSDTQTFMGLSVGWGDTYRWSLPDQYIDITGLTNGRYRLYAEVDPDNWFQENNARNNLSWINIRISGEKVTIVRYGRGA